MNTDNEKQFSDKTGIHKIHFRNQKSVFIRVYLWINFLFHL